MSNQIMSMAVELAGKYVSRNDCSPETALQFLKDTFAYLESKQGAVMPQGVRQGADIDFRDMSDQTAWPAPSPSLTALHPSPSFEMAKKIAATLVEVTGPSVKDDWPGVGQQDMICLEDGHRVILLAAYLRNRFGMTPDQYCARWGLPSDYPRTPPAYAEAKRQYAQSVGFGSAIRGKRSASRKV